MFLKYAATASLLAIVLVLIDSVHCAPAPLDQAQQVQNVGSFLSQLLRDYVPKNAKPYTIINGVPPNLNSPIGRIGAAPTRQQLGVFPYGQLIVAPPPQKPQPQLHVSQDRWSPVFPLTQTGGVRGRSDVQFVPMQTPYHDEPQDVEDSQEIITADLNMKSDADRDFDIAEFQIQSQMGF